MRFIGGLRHPLRMRATLVSFFFFVRLVSFAASMRFFCLVRVAHCTPPSPPSALAICYSAVFTPLRAQLLFLIGSVWSAEGSLYD